MGRYMNHPQVVMGQHHSILVSFGIVSINLSMTGVVMTGHIDRFFG